LEFKHLRCLAYTPSFCIRATTHNPFLRRFSVTEDILPGPLYNLSTSSNTGRAQRDLPPVVSVIAMTAPTSTKLLRASISSASFHVLHPLPPPAFQSTSEPVYPASHEKHLTHPRDESKHISHHRCRRCAKHEGNEAAKVKWHTADRGPYQVDWHVDWPGSTRGNYGSTPDRSPPA